MVILTYQQQQQRDSTVNDTADTFSNVSISKSTVSKDEDKSGGNMKSWIMQYAMVQ